MVDAAALAAAVFSDYLLAFPQAAAVSVDVGGQPKVPSKEYLDALCKGFTDAAKALVILDNSTGVTDSPGNAPPATCQIPGSSLGIPVFVGITQWAGPQTTPMLQVFVGKVLTRFAEQALVTMNPNPAVGTGVGVVGALNSGLAAAFRAAAPALLKAAFESKAIFCRDFNPANGLNPEVLKTIPAFVEAWAAGLETLTATVSYVGTGVIPSVAASSVGTGRFS
jgi:hypothetical protein